MNNHFLTKNIDDNLSLETELNGYYTKKHEIYLEYKKKSVPRNNFSGLQLFIKLT